MLDRHASPADLPVLAAIYNEGIADRVATFETGPRTAEDISGWLAGPTPVVVVEQAGRIVAFARLSVYRERACYSGIREFSVYVARSARGKGYGHAVMHRLIEEARRCGVHKIVARIFSDNHASLALCRRLGFRVVGIYEKHGQLDGQWRDCVIVELLLSPPA